MLLGDSELAAEKQPRVRELQEALTSFRIDEVPSLDAFAAPLREVLGLDSFVSYSLEQSGTSNTYDIATIAHHGMRDGFVRLFRDYVKRSEVQWAFYNPGRPDRRQRNRVLVRTPAELEATGVDGVKSLYPEVGVAGLDEMRVLVCDGPSLLAWVGGWQSGALTDHQSATLRALLPALEKRLVFARSFALSSPALLQAALDALGHPGYVLDSRGTVLLMNAAGRQDYEQDRSSVMAELRAADPTRYRMTPVAERDGKRFTLVQKLVDTRAQSILERVLRASRKWQLTSRQQQVLMKLVEGNANRNIAAMLGLSERTVEVHVGAILNRAQVENRSELVAHVLAP